MLINIVFTVLSTSVKREFFFKIRLNIVYKINKNTYSFLLNISELT